MPSSCVILLNSKAGALKMTPSQDQIQQLAQDIGLEAEIRYGDTPAEMQQTIKELVTQKAPLIVVAGGDGTVRLAVQEMVFSDSVLGIIPQGTWNNFATALRLPLDLASALRVLKDGKVQEVSVGKIDNHYFTESVGVGLFSDGLAVYGNGTNKNFFRGLNAFLRIFLAFPKRRVKVTADGKVIVERATICTVANTFRVAQGLAIAPDAKLTDDLLELVIVGDLERKEILPYFRALQAQVHPNLPKVTTLQAKEITIESLHHLNVHCDDRIIGTTPAHVSVQPRALKVMVDRL